MARHRLIQLLDIPLEESDIAGGMTESLTMIVTVALRHGKLLRSHIHAHHFALLTDQRG